MSEETNDLIASFETIKRRNELWWLGLEQCKECNTFWLVAAEERQNDIYFLLKLNADVAQLIIEKNVWPKDFDSYENLIMLGNESGRSVKFLDLLDSSLESTIIDLVKGRPEITLGEIGELLNLEPEEVLQLANKLKAEKNIKFHDF